MKVCPNVWKVFANRHHYLASQVELDFFGISIQHILIMSDSDSELNKYSILMMTMIAKGLTQPIFERLSLQVSPGMGLA